jgi:hypothetical protein
MACQYATEVESDSTTRAAAARSPPSMERAPPYRYCGIVRVLTVSALDSRGSRPSAGFLFRDVGGALFALASSVLPHVFAHVLGVLLWVTSAPFTTVEAMRLSARLTAATVIRVRIRSAVKYVGRQFDLAGHGHTSPLRSDIRGRRWKRIRADDCFDASVGDSLLTPLRRRVVQADTWSAWLQPLHELASMPVDVRPDDGPCPEDDDDREDCTDK